MDHSPWLGPSLAQPPCSGCEGCSTELQNVQGQLLHSFIKHLLSPYYVSGSCWVAEEHQCLEKSVSLLLFPRPLLMRLTERAQKAQEEERQGLCEERLKQIIGDYVLQNLGLSHPTPMQPQNVSGERIIISLVKFPGGSG